MEEPELKTPIANNAGGNPFEQYLSMKCMPSVSRQPKSFGHPDTLQHVRRNFAGQSQVEDDDKPKKKEAERLEFEA